MHQIQIRMSTLLPDRLKQVCMSAALLPTMLQHYTAYFTGTVAAASLCPTQSIHPHPGMHAAQLLLRPGQLQLRRWRTQSC